jgi:hypothetical protein
MFVLISLVSWLKEVTFWIELSQMMNHGAFSTIRKCNAKACNGKHQHRRDQKKARMSRAQVKTMLICFFDQKGIVHFEFLEQGRTVNQHFYLEIMGRLREAVPQRRPELWPHALMLHHDNAPAHDVLTVWEFLAKKSILKLDHPPYSLHLAHATFGYPQN